MTFAEVLREALNRRGWTPERAARAIREHGGDVQRRAVQTWLDAQATPNSRHGMPIVRAMGISPAKFLESTAQAGKGNHEGHEGRTRRAA